MGSIAIAFFQRGLESAAEFVALVSELERNSNFEYAVLTAADFTTQFGGSGYTPTAGELVYAYQVFNNDPPSTDNITTQIVLPVAAPPANNIVLTGPQ